MTIRVREKNRLRRQTGAPLGMALFAAAAALRHGVAATPAAAQDSGMPITVETAIGPEVGMAELRVKGDEIHLTLEEAVELALSRNLNLRTQRYSREQARLGIQEATGIYDFNLLASALDLDGRESGGVEPRRRRRPEAGSHHPLGRRLAARPDRRRPRRQLPERPLRDQLAVLAAQSVVSTAASTSPTRSRCCAVSAAARRTTASRSPRSAATSRSSSSSSR